jgi:translation initiation factor 2 alpha subunit (eIF-2alpha)
MSKEFKAIVIGHKHEEEKAYTSNVDTKKKRYKELFNHLNQFISLDEMSSFDGSIYDEVIKRFTEKHHANYPTLRIEKVAELHEMSLHKIESMISAFNSIDIAWNIEKNAPTETPDFRILTKSEDENKRYKLLSNIVSSIEQAQIDGMMFYPSPMLSGFNGWMQYDFNTSKIVPNISRIQGTERNY